MRGRKPKPTKLHERHGTLEKSRHAARAKEPIPRGDGMNPPEWFSNEQKAGWLYAVDHAPPGILYAIDRGMLTVWVEAEDRHRRAVLAQRVADSKRGAQALLMKTTVPGVYQQSAYVGMINRAAQLMIKAASELGFSPASRPRLTPGEVAPLVPGKGKKDLDDGANPLDSYLHLNPARTVN